MANFARTFMARRADQKHWSLRTSGTKELSRKEEVGAARALTPCCDFIGTVVAKLAQ
jgi:hypothetical protein